MGVSHTHFNGKEAVNHVAEVKAKGIISSVESHGIETPGHISAGADAARETATIIALLLPFAITSAFAGYFLVIFSLGWLFWKTGRSAWLAWFRLERLHRIVEQERWEIEHHRPQEREELEALYSTKGFEGKLLQDVVDVLMADSERLLRVMVEEELGLTLAAQEHPLKQALGACVGCLISIIVCLTGYFVYPPIGLLVGCVVCVGIASAISAYHAGNRWIPAIIWNEGLLVLAFATVYFLMEYVRI